MIGPFARQSMLAAALAVLTACGSDDSTGPDEANVEGAYTLTTINGQHLPVVVEQQGSDRAEVTQGTVTLNANGTFSDIIQLRFTISGQVTSETDAANGTWTRTGSTVQFNPTAPSGSAPYSMTWDGDDRLTQTFEGFTLVYER